MSRFLPQKNLSFLLVFCVFAVINVQAQWVEQSNALRKRSETTSVVYNNKLYTFLGFKNADLETEPSSEVFDPVTGKWTMLASIPSKKSMTHQGVVLVDDKVWHIGGRVGEHPGPLTSETWIYNISTNRWSAGPQLLNPATGRPLRWGGGGAALIGRTIHLFGGFANTACRGDQATMHLTLDVDAWMANPKSPAPWKNESAAMPVPRNHMGTVVLGGKIYAIGGQFGHDCGQGIDTVFAHVYDPAADNWTELTPLPMARSHVEGSIFAADGKIYVLGGQSSRNANTNLVTEFDPAGNGGAGSWTDRPDLLLPRKYEGLSAKAMGNMFIISHGGEGLSNNTRQYVYTTTVNRNPVYQLGFPVQCANVSVGAGQSVVSKALLYTIDGAAEYTVSSSAPWLKIGKNASGTTNQNGTDIAYTVDAAGLEPGNYNAVITAQASASNPGYTSATYCINMVVQSTPEISAPAEAIFSGVRGRTSAAQNITINNSGAGPLQVTNLAFGGTNAGAFKLLNAPQTPFTVAPGASYDLQLQFVPAYFQVGALSATLTVESDDANEALSTVNLFGLSANGEQGNNEPPLDAIVKTLGYDINVGGAKLIIGTGAEALGDEVLIPLFKKAGSGPVGMVPVARYSPDDVLAYGFYVKQDGKPLTTEVGNIALNYEQSLNPGVVAGSKASFDPGNSVFGLYTGATSYARQNTYTEDDFNTGPLPHSARIYPLKNRTGQPVPNSYLVAFEPAANGDYQDYVFVLSNVVPAFEVETLEAEDAQLKGAAVANDHEGFSGLGYADYEDDNGDYVEWTVQRTAPGQAIVLFRYALSGSSARKLRLEVNGKMVNSSFNFPGTGEWGNWSNRTDTVTLVAGANKIRLTASGDSGPNVDYMSLRNFTTDPLQSSDVLEAEDAVVGGAVVDAKHEGYTGTGFVDFVDLDNEFVEWDLVKQEAGTITLTFRYANGGQSARPMQLSVNGTNISSALAFPSTNGWETWKQLSVTVKVEAGSNKIRLSTIGQSGPNLDHLTWKEVTEVVGIGEAELAELGGAMEVATKVPGFTGTGYADIVYKFNAYVEWTVERPAAGATVLQFRYSNGYISDRPLRLQVNGERITETFYFPSTGAWDNWKTVSITVPLAAGENKVRLTSIGYHGPNLDHLKWFDASDAVEGGRIAARAVPQLEIAETFKATVAPNPASGPANLVVSGTTGKLEISISNMSGKLHKQWIQQWSGSGSIALPIQDLNPGMYLVQVRQGNKTAVTKLVVQ